MSPLPNDNNDDENTQHVGNAIGSSINSIAVRRARASRPAERPGVDAKGRPHHARLPIADQLVPALLPLAVVPTQRVGQHLVPPAYGVLLPGPPGGQHRIASLTVVAL